MPIANRRRTNRTVEYALAEFHKKEWQGIAILELTGCFGRRGTAPGTHA